MDVRNQWNTPRADRRLTDHHHEARIFCFISLHNLGFLVHRCDHSQDMGPPIPLLGCIQWLLRLLVCLWIRVFVWHSACLFVNIKTILYIKYYAFTVTVSSSLDVRCLGNIRFVGTWRGGRSAPPAEDVRWIVVSNTSRANFFCLLVSGSILTLFHHFLFSWSNLT